MADCDADKTYLGRFWLPHMGENSAVEGVMTLDKNGATIRLRDQLDDDLLEDATIFARLQGRYNQATLLNCYDSWTRDGKGEILSSRVSSTLVAMGCIREDVGGYCCEFRLPGSEKWLNDPCFDLKIGDAQEMHLHFKARESFESVLTSDVTLERTYRASIAGDRSGTERYEIVRKMIYRLKPDRRLIFDDHWDMMNRLKRLFEFLMQHRLFYEDMKIYDSSPIISYEPDIKIHHVDSYSNNQKQLNRHEFLIYSHEVGSKVDELINKWMELMAEHPAPLQHYFHAFDRQRKDRVLHFVWNVATLEELHKMRFGRKKLDLIDRLKAMRDRWAGAFHRMPSDDVLRHIKNSRHYHAHAAADLRTKAAKGWLLFRYGDFLMALSNLEILSHLGFQKQEAISLTRHNHWMREALDLTTYPGPDD
ncbi:ApeA N-terminal domain 1-containing protein [Advenella mimigardefordensis]|uniref:Uncharacterized protein n=1 Tax=Advenella mimigardefordensis (strain DSM 17166 / LMG 22922 / DPN7) TaxID=1247726 RepID=W0P9I3_ADVMD|nr:hypothetical protein [Advenella mimigardefordensis]AHG63386.1 hypothetical protein MIM_c12920 [Advenella mimigardefordensis DPN7]